MVGQIARYQAFFLCERNLLSSMRKNVMHGAESLRARFNGLYEGLNKNALVRSTAEGIMIWTKAFSIMHLCTHDGPIMEC